MLEDARNESIAKPHSAAILPPVQNGNNALVASPRDLQASGHGHVEMPARQVTPSPVVIRRAEVGGGDGHGGSPEAPFGVSPVVASHLAAAAAAAAAGLPSPEERRAQCRRVDPKACMECVFVAARPSCMKINMNLWLEL